MAFRKYQHVERLGTSATNGLLDGTVYIFPKIDGTNASVWIDGDGIHAGSRNRELSVDNDNAGFCKHVIDNEHRYVSAILHIAEKMDAIDEDIRLYGEWLVPHTLKSYRETAWHKFYLFDVRIGDDYVPYDDYKDCGLEVIPPLAIGDNLKTEDIVKWLDRNQYLIDDGIGEGVVIKRYGFVNKFGHIVWGKIVRNEFKERNTLQFGAPRIVPKQDIERKIVEYAITDTLLEKEFAKLSVDEWSSRSIPRFLSTVYHCLVTEELWSTLKKFKSPTINFRALNKITIEVSKEFLKGKGVL